MRFDGVPLPGYFFRKVLAGSYLGPDFEVCGGRYGVGPRGGLAEIADGGIGNDLGRNLVFQYIGRVNTPHFWG